MILDLARVSKSIAGGITGAAAAAGGAGGIYLFVPAYLQDKVPWYGYFVATVIIGGGGFLTGFLGVYLAPANDPPPSEAAVAAAASVTKAEEKGAADAAVAAAKEIKA